MRSTVASCHPWSTLLCKHTCRTPVSHSARVQRSTSPHQRLNRHLNTRLPAVPAGQSRRVTSRASPAEVLVSFYNASAVHLPPMHAMVLPQHNHNLHGSVHVACQFPEGHTSQSGPTCCFDCANQLGTADCNGTLGSDALGGCGRVSIPGHPGCAVRPVRFKLPEGPPDPAIL